MKKLLLTTICSATLLVVGCGEDKNEAQAQAQQPAKPTLEVKASNAVKVKQEPVQEETSTKPVYTEGSDYTILDSKIDLGINTPHLIEFFWFGCSHCQNFEPTLNEWQKAYKGKATLIRIPAVIPQWKRDAQVYYTMVEMDIVEKTFDETFRLFKHNRIARRPDLTLDDLLTHFQKLGVDATKFMTVYNSDSVAERMNTAAALFKQSQTSGVPAFVVNGTHLISLRNLKEREELITVVDAFL